jgi:hypothetical protein
VPLLSERGYKLLNEKGRRLYIRGGLGNDVSQFHGRERRRTNERMGEIRQKEENRDR